ACGSVVGSGAARGGAGAAAGIRPTPGAEGMTSQIRAQFVRLAGAVEEELARFATRRGEAEVQLEAAITAALNRVDAAAASRLESVDTAHADTLRGLEEREAELRRRLDALESELSAQAESASSSVAPGFPDGVARPTSPSPMDRLAIPIPSIDPGFTDPTDAAGSLHTADWSPAEDYGSPSTDFGWTAQPAPPVIAPLAPQSVAGASA